MSRHAARASTDPTRTSPKVTWGTIVAGVLTILASAVAAIPQETWATPASRSASHSAAAPWP